MNKYNVLGEYQCLDCGCRFDTANRLNMHIDKWHPVDYGMNSTAGTLWEDPNPEPRMSPFRWKIAKIWNQFWTHNKHVVAQMRTQHTYNRIRRQARRSTR